MSNSMSKVMEFENEKILEYLPGSREREELKKALKDLKEEILEIPLIIGGREIRTENTGQCIMPHDNKKVIAKYHMADEAEVKMAVNAALEAKKDWERLPWEHRAAIFMRAAELASGSWRAKLNAATMLCQSKTFIQAEIDSACELTDFLRYNVRCLYELYGEQPMSLKGSWNRTEYRPLEGFVFAVSPFNFTAIGCNLAAAPAISGNVVLWKPASNAVYSAYMVFKLLQEAGLPDGVINFIPGKGGNVGDAVLADENLAGIHFTGSTEVFRDMWKTVGNRLDLYRTFPRLVGETGGKNYIFAHSSADVEALTASIIRGAFEYQGQKCSAASRGYIPKSLWPELKGRLIEELGTIKAGNVEDFNNFMGAVIDRHSFNAIKGYIDYARDSVEAEIISGGNCDDSVGYFIEPTVIVVKDPHFKTMEEEIFGPVVTLYIYEDKAFEDTLELCGKTSQYGLTGAIFGRDRYALVKMEEELMHTAGNFYINDKPTGAVVGQQPFGGSRASGTNDKAGSKLNMLRWICPRVIKENFDYVLDYRYENNIE
ncbi:L-glutamate gamma-semialdehyde dehydrogenase [Lutispora saccharofermentans]|uniref:L-glutamate gamma-semialdehyde dehydrogenase n=1 Tax=Lutispora saccharofermentans TaxID=3024236 RepID=A0ABT1NGI0_9FIRM|nr:L-glutamate gamma-semialdehyde dehydrogenase [Lutispora saccharofermentans]MCQ1529248.1 L-glutamate gamma-semialdehyde dehydrogenase [Lutispora saccharofermentans]